MQAVIVFVIVAAAALYASWQLMPRRLRHWLIGRGAAIAPSRRAWLARVEAKAEAGACGSCKGCADDVAPVALPGRVTGQATIPIPIPIHRRSDP